MNVFGALLALLVVAKIAKASSAEQPLTIAVGEQNGSAPPVDTVADSLAPSNQNLPWFLVNQPSDTAAVDPATVEPVVKPVDADIVFPLPYEPTTPDAGGTPYPLIIDTRESEQGPAIVAEPIAPDQDIYNPSDPFFSANPDRYHWSGSQWMRKGW